MIFGEGLTYDDITIVPNASSVLPKEADLTSSLTNTITLHTPILSAAMDTVTESQMAIALALEGGLGVVHKNLEIEKQTQQIEIVKRAANGIINKPIVLSKNETIEHAMKLMNMYSVTSFPIVDKNQIPLGIVTNRDFHFEKNFKEKIDAIMTKDLIVAKVGISLEKAKQILKKNKIEKLLIVNSKNKLVGLICKKDILNNTSYPLATKDENGRLRVGAACGISGKEFERVQELFKVGTDVIFIDTAHGHHINVINMVKKVRKKYPSCQIVGGNIATKEAAKDLIKVGCNALKVGIGPGSICTTRIVTGVGVPQVSAILDIINVSKKAKIPLIADGGIRSSGDITKALGLGAGTVMLGNILAGTEESPGEVFYQNGGSYKNYRGMGSISAMKKGSKDRYFQSNVDSKKLVPEGVEGIVPLKGKVKDVIFQMVGGVKSGMGLTGAKNIKDLQKKVKFLKITNAAFRESHVHDVTMMHSSSNYSKT